MSSRFTVFRDLAARLALAALFLAATLWSSAGVIAAVNSGAHAKLYRRLGVYGLGLVALVAAVGFAVATIAVLWRGAGE